MSKGTELCSNSRNLLLKPTQRCGYSPVHTQVAIFKRQSYITSQNFVVENSNFWNSLSCWFDTNITLSQVNLLDKGSRFVTIFWLFSGASKNGFLVCKMYTSSVNRSLTLPTVVIHPGVSAVKVSTPYHEKILRFQGFVLGKAEL